MSKQQIDNKNMDKFPHLINIKEGISTLKSLHERLELRTRLIKENYSDKTEYEKNEIEIILIDTKIRLIKVNKSILDRTDYYNKYFSSINEMLPEVTKRYSSMRKKALLEISNPSKDMDIKALKAEIKNGNDKVAEMEKNHETKIRHYLELKNILEPEKEKEKPALKVSK
jgi:hypothetical protein